jgi:tetratricopeptide (TPR) repeat protein
MALDSELLEPAVRLIQVAVERDRIAEAYDAASQLVSRRPKAAYPRFALSYVLRYGGAIDQAVEECDTALSLDPRNPRFRNCGRTNSIAGRYERALQFLALDPASSHSLTNSAKTRMRQGRTQEAAELLLQANSQHWASYVTALEGQTLDEARVRRFVDEALSVRDGEEAYATATFLAPIGEYEAALELISGGIAQGFCAYPWVETDPLLSGLRADQQFAAGFAEVREAGKACHEAFMAHVEGRSSSRL